MFMSFFPHRLGRRYGGIVQVAGKVMSLFRPPRKACRAD
jgi:hypothetical protein